MTVLDVLEGVRELLHDPSHWIKGARAMNGNGVAVSPHDPRAVCWCLEGAVMHEAPEQYTLQLRTLIALSDRLMTSNVNPANVQVFMFNDWLVTTHDDVLALLDQTIVELKDDGE